MDEPTKVDLPARRVPRRMPSPSVRRRVPRAGSARFVGLVMVVVKSPRPGLAQDGGRPGAPAAGTGAAPAAGAGTERGGLEPLWMVALAVQVAALGLVARARSWLRRRQALRGVRAQLD